MSRKLHPCAALVTRVFHVRSPLGHAQASNPPGNETEVAKYLHSLMQKEGISAIPARAEPNRLRLIARIKGNGSKQPILILGHTDVVGVQRERWTEDSSIPLGQKPELNYRNN